MAPISAGPLATTTITMFAVFFSSVIADVHGSQSADRQGSQLKERLDSSSSIHFAALGDWGAPLTDDSKSLTQRGGQQAVADGVASWLERVALHGNEHGHDEKSSPFILSLGDNFYPKGATDIEDMVERFNKSFDEVYNHDVFQDVPWYITAGNKDYEGNANPAYQMDYPDSRWVYPDYYQRVVREVDVPSSNEDEVHTLKLEVLVIDTMQLSGTIHYPAKCDSRAEETSQQIADRGQKWLDHHLTQSDADYLIVAGHFPYHSVPDLEDMLESNQVSAYVHGHEHCQKYKKKKHNGVHQFVSGAGMELNCKGDSIDHQDAIGGFLSFHATQDVLLVTFHDQSGFEIHHVEISPRGSEHDDQRQGQIEIA